MREGRGTFGLFGVHSSMNILAYYYKLAYIPAIYITTLFEVVLLELGGVTVSGCRLLDILDFFFNQPVTQGNAEFGSLLAGGLLFLDDGEFIFLLCQVSCCHHLPASSARLLDASGLPSGLGG